MRAKHWALEESTGHWMREWELRGGIGAPRIGFWPLQGGGWGVHGIEKALRIGFWQLQGGGWGVQGVEKALRIGKKELQGVGGLAHARGFFRHAAMRTTPSLVNPAPQAYQPFQ